MPIYDFKVVWVRVRVWVRFRALEGGVRVRVRVWVRGRSRARGRGRIQQIIDISCSTRAAIGSELTHAARLVISSEFPSKTSKAT